jgi:hypothetical protein
MKSKNRGRQFEDRVKSTIASGALWFSKGDLKDKDNTFECKYTDKKGFRLTLEMLEKIWEQALNAQTEPRFVIGIKRNEKEIFVISCGIQLERKIA